MKIENKIGIYQITGAIGLGGGTYAGYSLNKVPAVSFVVFVLCLILVVVVPSVMATLEQRK